MEDGWKKFKTPSSYRMVKNSMTELREINDDLLKYIFYSLLK
jgi:hypothetical protein